MNIYQEIIFDAKIFSDLSIFVWSKILQLDHIYIYIWFIRDIVENMSGVFGIMAAIIKETQK